VHFAQIVAAALAEITFHAGDEDFHNGVVADVEAVFFFGAFAQFYYFADIFMPGDNWGMVVTVCAK